ncbi:MAG: aromatic ring-hydroxylating dioxygenase subunit alpha [Novosphingobium sp.]|nr:aromatic ring-hydroxylating dioxygenase subunit alpha [Novosphingobium sp.]
MTSQIDEALAKVPFQVTDPERIPAQRYYDEAFFELEREHVWSKVWQMACRLEEIPEVGDFTEYTILDKSVIVINTPTGIKAYHNACRHRGVRLVNGPGHLGEGGFICPFHGWRWNAQGECTFVFSKPIFSEDVLDEDEINLPPVRCETWAGCAFINFDNDARPLREGLGPVEAKMDSRNADKLKMDWWYGTVLPTNWKLAMEAFMEGYHTMQTHPQLYWMGAGAEHGCDGDGRDPGVPTTGREAVNRLIDSLCRVGTGMAGMVHQTEIDVLEKLRDMDVPEDDPQTAAMMLYGRAMQEIEADAKQRGAPMFDIAKMAQEVPTTQVEFTFPHFFLLPTFGAMSSYRIRPLSAETCFYEIWSLVLRPDDEPYDTPTEPTILPYDSKDFPEIPQQDYSNLPIQQLGLHAGGFTEMRLSRDYEGTISNYQRLIDGYIAGLDKELLTKAQHAVNTGLDSPINDLPFGPTLER